MDTKFKSGDRVRYIGTLTPSRIGKTGTVLEDSDDNGVNVKWDDNHHLRAGYMPTNLEMVSRALELVPKDEEPIYADLPDTKATNPKDAIGSTKLGMDVVPDTAKVYMALAFTEGALKYGKFNWRVAGVRASIYKAALERHLAKYWNGEWADPKTGVPHLASVMACAAIIMDANAAGKLTDDRPPAINLASIIDGLEPAVAHLKDLFKDHNPHHHTELDKGAA